MRQFYRLILLQREKRQKRPFGPRLTSSAKIRHVGVYFAKTGCKIEDGFTDIFGFQVWKLVSDRSDRWGPTFTSGLLIRFAAKREDGRDHFHGAAISFLP